jgi:diacylglycerol kinase (ATP)
MLSQPETARRPALFARAPGDNCRQVVISLNPRAGSGRRRRQALALESQILAAGYRIRVTDNLAELTEMTETADSAAAIRAVVAVGGDGTASCVRRHVPLAIPILPLPMGTENLLARYLGQSPQQAAIIDTLDNGVVVDLDLGRANGHPFLLMLSAGFDAEVVRRLHECRQGNITRASYLKPTLQAIRSYRYPEMRLYCGNEVPESVAPLTCRWLFGFNLPLYALGWQLAPQADGADGEFDVCTFERGSLPHAGRYLWHVLRGSHLALTDARLTRCRTFRVEAAEPIDIAYQLDGDFGGMLPVNVEIHPGQLRLLVSRAAAEKLGFTVVDSSSSRAGIGQN